MMKFRRRFLALLILILMPAVAGFASAEKDGAFPPLNDDGFLDSGEFVFEDAENGIWRYASPTLWIEIFRCEQKKPARVWYEAEIRCATDEEDGGPRMIAADPENWMKKNGQLFQLLPMRSSRENWMTISRWSSGRPDRVHNPT